MAGRAAALQQPEAEVILTALTRRVASFELTEERERRLNITPGGFDPQPLRIEPV